MLCPNCETELEFDTYEDAWVCPECGEIVDEEENQGLSVYEAAEIWASHGKDEDYMFGYSEEELERAL